MVELSTELKQMIQEDPQKALEVADEHLTTLMEEEPLYPGGGYSQSYLEAAREVNEAIHLAAGDEGAKGTVYDVSEPVRQG